jgi:hypothetical protein
VPWRFEEEATINSCLIGLNGVLRVGTRLCEGNSRVTHLNDDLELSNESGSLPELSKEGSSTGGEEEDESIHMEEVLEDSKNDQVETLWFRLLDVYVEASIEMHNAIGESKSAIHQRVISSFKQFVQSILTSLLLSTSPQVSLPRLLLRLIYSQARGETTFADFRDIFLSMLDTYKYEGKLLEMTNRLFDRDLFHSMKDVVDKRAKGWRPRRAACEICDANILDLSLLQPALAWGVDDEQEEEPQQSKRYVLFHCGHGFHTDCLNRQVGMQVCIVCQQDTPSRKGKEKATHV